MMVRIEKCFPLIEIREQIRERALEFLEFKFVYETQVTY